MKASVTSDADTPGHYQTTVARRRNCLRASVRVDWMGYSFVKTSESSLLARLLNVTGVFGELDAFASQGFAQNVGARKKIFSAMMPRTNMKHRCKLC